MNLLFPWWPVLIGLAVLYLPTYWELANGIWNTEEQAHGPIVLVVALYLIWRKRHIFLSPHPPVLSPESLSPIPPSPQSPSLSPKSSVLSPESLSPESSVLSPPALSPFFGWPLLVFGLLLYALGRSQGILLFEVGSQIPVLLGTLLITLGGGSARSLWFALFYLLFMIPLSSFVVDAVTGPLKQHVSEITENVLYTFGFPIARSGVTLSIGNYQLLVADACSGLHSMFSLSAMGLLYLYLMGHRTWLRNVLLIASILPIAFLANVARVVLLVLVTYYFGDEAGQGFVHGFAGILLFVFALLFLFALDSALGIFFRRGKRESRQ